ncbi:MAG: SDR family oxidoreductase [Chloroflexi bacterium]|nr:SDR family oxidoreductase [Chloroflexota bacterium]MCL5074322.1 SDR family oxidoreductase [Chloroflexota bacterium]
MDQDTNLRTVPQDFEGKVILVTGAGRGIGKAVALEFLQRGAIVAATDLQPPDWEVDESAKGRLLRLKMDVTQAREVEETVRQIADRYDGIDVLVNNAGANAAAAIAELTEEAWDFVFAVNAKGTFFCTKAVVKDMLARGKAGRIVSIASIAGRMGFPYASNYCASKAAVIGFTRSLAAELGPRGITVNAVCPGTVYTEMIKGLIDRESKRSGNTTEQVKETLEARIPLHRLQQPEDIARTVAFLASEGARNISGEAINVDGGQVRD